MARRRAMRAAVERARGLAALGLPAGGGDAGAAGGPGAVELGLRVAGAGHPAGFFVPVTGQRAEMTNYALWLALLPARHRPRPVIGRLPRPKPAGAYRIFVLGGSAAMGTPEPAFGFGRVLEVLLEERYPGTDFEVVNAAMAAINSHVVREIARDCARRQPDLFVVYLGNNEVVGPYGPGTVFAPPAPGCRRSASGLRLRRLRGGQLLAGALARLRPAAGGAGALAGHGDVPRPPGGGRRPAARADLRRSSRTTCRGSPG